LPLRQYAYEACDFEGKVHSGQMGAENEHEVVVALQNRQLVPVKVELQEEISSFFEGKSISKSDVIDFTNGLCTLVEARVPLDRALALLEGLTDKPRVQQLIADLRADVKEGKSLAGALQARPEIFSRIYVNMVHAGEEGGILDQLLPKLANFLTVADEAKRTVISAMIYPVILLTVGILSVTLLMIFVVPQFTSLFEDFGAEMPASAAFLISFSTWLKTYGWTLLFIPFIAVFGWKQLDETPERRLQRDQMILDLPLLGDLLLQSESSRFCRTLGALLDAGIPLLKSLQIVQGIMENQVLTAALAQAEEAVRGGTSLGKALVNTGKFPVLLAQLVIVGEEAGRTSSILNKLAETFDGHVKQQTSRLVAMMEPMLILFLGIIVGGIVITMLSAVFSINDIQY